MILIFYFLLIKPQQKQLKERQKMLSNLKVGDKVLTAGGIIGTISSLDNDKIEVEIAKNVKVTMLKSSVTSVLNN
jgi:preprotein translocase subunit YajC